MNRNRWITTFLAVASILIIYASTWFGWVPWNTFQGLHGNWNMLPDYVRAPSEIPPSTILSALTTLLTMFLTGTLVLLLFPDRIRRMEKALHTSPAGLLRLTLFGLLTGRNLYRVDRIPKRLVLAVLRVAVVFTDRVVVRLSLAVLRTDLLVRAAVALENGVGQVVHTVVRVVDNVVRDGLNGLV